MAEHAVMMALAAMKRLLIEHAKLASGTFDQFRPNRMLAGSVCGILGFGGIGIATARLMRALGAKIHAINRRGATEEPIDWIGTAPQSIACWRNSDILVLSVPLTPATRALLGRRELTLMKNDAVLINLARGEIIDEAALFAHLQARPRVHGLHRRLVGGAGAAWPIPDGPRLHEPAQRNRFAAQLGFNKRPARSGFAARRGECRRALEGGDARHLVPPADRMM